jgi:hypothetical protein
MQTEIQCSDTVTGLDLTITKDVHFSLSKPRFQVPLSYITRFLCVCTEGSILIITGLAQITCNGCNNGAGDSVRVLQMACS